MGALVVYDRAPNSIVDATIFPDQVDVVLPNATGRGVRRRTVSARRVPITDAILLLRDLDVEIPGVAAWSAAFAAGLGLVARGRLYPSVTPAGWDAWAAGPLDPADRRLLAQLATAFHPAAHAVALERSSPLRVHSAAGLIRAAWDGIADTLPRTAAAAVVTGAATAVTDRGGSARTRVPSGRARFAVAAPVAAQALRPWLVDAAGGFGGEQGADVALRVELDDLHPAPPATGPDTAPRRRPQKTAEKSHARDVRPSARAVLQLTSRAESSLVVDAADLFHSPASVVARFGDDAETDLLRALRRGARAWPPLEPLLHQRAPTGLDLDDDLLAELLAEGTGLLGGTGVEVLWPSEILADG
ncbi:MAG TPA: hypothetical protein VGG23_05015, partial [Acidimicrobiales bacterium]